MTDFPLTPGQSGVCDEINAEPLQVLEDGAVVVKVQGTGELRRIGPRGANDPFTGTLEEAAPDPELPDAEEMAAEIIDGTAEEVEIDASMPREGDMAVDTRGGVDEVRQEVVRAMDRADEELILAEIQGKTLKTFVYSFTQSGDLMTDLTVAGVNEVVRLMNERGGCQIGIDDRPPIIEELTEGGDEKVRVMVFAKDGRRPGTGRWGVATEPKKFPAHWKNGGQIDKFAVTKALNKAQRNALKMQIPEETRQTIIAQFLQTPDAVKALQPVGAGAVAALPPPSETAEAQQYKKEIVELRDKIYVHDRVKKLNPARYNAMLAQVESDDERLKDYRDHLAQLLVEVTPAEEAS